MYSRAYVEITNICNKTCSFCPKTRRVPRLMSEAEFTEIATKIKGVTDYIYYHVMGEPLTHPLLPRFIEIANGLGFKSAVTTNGSLLKKRGDELIESGVYKVNISLHSFENGSDEKHKQYVQLISDFAKKAADKGTIVVFRLWNKGVDGGMNEMSLKILQEQIVGDWVENSRGIKIRDRIFLEWGERFEWPDVQAEIKGEKFFCYGLKDQFGILSDGTVVPCCLDSDGVINLGNIFTDDIDDVLSSERARNIADGFKCGKASEELCKRCGYAQRFV